MITKEWDIFIIYSFQHHSNQKQICWTLVQEYTVYLIFLEEIIADGGAVDPQPPANFLLNPNRLGHSAISWPALSQKLQNSALLHDLS